MNFFSSRKTKKSVHDEEPPPRSPLKTSPSKSKFKPARGTKDENFNHKSHYRPSSASAHSSPSLTKSSNSNRYSYDPQAIHPLNLPPDLRELSALSNMADIKMTDADAPSSPQSPAPGSFDSTKVNGPAANGDGPTPPPHKSSPSSPVAAPVTAEDAEAFKNEGNTFYKNKQYRNAIEAYTKGTS